MSIRIYSTNGASRLQVTDVEMSDSGVYTCIVTYRNFSDSASAKLTGMFLFPVQE